jgi:hypothetical protein
MPPVPSVPCLPALLLLLAAGARAEPAPPVVVRAARLFDGASDSVLSGGVAVLVEGGKIRAVGKTVAMPPGAEVSSGT